MTQTTIAVTILHEIHYSIEVPKTKQNGLLVSNRVLQHYSEYCGGSGGGDGGDNMLGV